MRDETKKRLTEVGRAVGIAVAIIGGLALAARFLGPEATGVIILVMLLFLLVRALILWYFKISHRVALQEETNRLLREILSALNTTESKPLT